ncbi:arsenate reductase ArsC [Photobacterium sp. TY1-4]|uniref:arsenate reductase/protein-tyrosine-phosphatase family protein n=1 Tax=Photobacterium sp. TY1-4 TaxID=2899122 RepID=UPI0021BE51E9|nr:arsenate reductase ArsC [Photobacterium sp. TY1-4]UXI03534.1 arsenate reductase ArsC [Photobacterium sp. TY1-4]
MKILFICRHNTCRSILAEAIARRFMPAGFQVASAGSDPSGDIHPYVCSYLKAMGLDPTDFRSKSWEELTGFHPDIVISVCDETHGEPCPNWLADGIRVSWALNNPLEANTQAEFDQACYVASTSLKRRIDKLAGLDFAAMSREDISAALAQLHAM